MKLELQKIKKETLDIDFGEFEIHVKSPSKKEYELLQSVANQNNLDAAFEGLSVLLSKNTENQKITREFLEELDISDLMLIIKSLGDFYKKLTSNPNL